MFLPYKLRIARIMGKNRRKAGGGKGQKKARQFSRAFFCPKCMSQFYNDLPLEPPS